MIQKNIIKITKENEQAEYVQASGQIQPSSKNCFSLTEEFSEKETERRVKLWGKIIKMFKGARNNV